MILQIRATSGGGKTTLARYLFLLADCKPFEVQKTARGEKVLLNKGRWRGYPFYVVGPYDNNGTGGCDRISKVEDVIALVDKVARPSHSASGDHKAIVCFEGLLLAHSWGAMGEHVHEHFGDRYINGFIGTTMEQCYANVLKRRARAGADNTDKERIAKIRKNVEADYHRVDLAHARVTARGGRLIDIPYEDSTAFTEKYINDWIDVQDILYGAP